MARPSLWLGLSHPTYLPKSSYPSNGDSVDPEQELSSDDIGSANRACPPQPGDKGGMAALAFDEDVCINEPGHDPLPHLALRFLGRRHPPRLGRESVRGTTRPLAG